MQAEALAMSGPVAFSNPPVTEVVFSVAFGLTQPLTTAHVGAYWFRIRDRFPQVRENAPLPGVAIPQMVEGEVSLQVQLPFLELPPLRRVWFISAEGRDLIQLQEDRFVFNWRRNAADEGYPGHESISARFEEHWAGFLGFLEDEGLGPLTPVGLELVYVNQITGQMGLDDVGFCSALVDHRRDASRSRFLPMPLARNSADIYPLPEHAGILQVQSQGNPSGVRLDITARGAPPSGNEDGRRAWFAVAHDWIVRSFVDVTATELHVDHWRREA